MLCKLNTKMLSEERISRSLQLFPAKRHLIILVLVRQCYADDNFNQRLFELIEASLEHLPDLEGIVGVCAAGFDQLTRLLNKEKKSMGIAKDCDLKKKGLRATLRSFIVLIESLIKRLQKRFEREFASLKAISMESEIIIRLSELYLNVF